MKCRAVLASTIIALAVFTGCPGEGGSDDRGQLPDSTSPNTRTYTLGFEALRYQIGGGQRWVFDESGWRTPTNSDAETLEDVAGGDEEAGLAELLVVPAHIHGVPWNEFGGDDENPQNLPGKWLSDLQAMRDKVKASGLNLVLSLNPTNARYDNLAPLVKSDGAGGQTLQDNWLNEYCPNPSASGNPDKWLLAYARYVEWMVKLFEPQYVLLARRINLYEENCGEVKPGSYESIVSFANKAHERLDEASIEVTTVVSVDVEDLYGYPRTPGRCSSMTPKECFETRRGLVEPIAVDRLGLASYPGAALTSLKELPSDWLAYVGESMSGRQMVITGLGVPGRSVEEKSGVCVPYIESDELLQRDLLEQGLAMASSLGMEFVVWTAASDFYEANAIGSCVCSESKDVCDHLEQLGASSASVRPQLIQGLYDVNGTERKAGALWRTMFEQ